MVDKIERWKAESRAAQATVEAVMIHPWKTRDFCGVSFIDVDWQKLEYASVCKKWINLISIE